MSEWLTPGLLLAIGIQTVAGAFWAGRIAAAVEHVQTAVTRLDGTIGQLASKSDLRAFEQRQAARDDRQDAEINRRELKAVQ